jgi:hypothetical protein
VDRCLIADRDASKILFCELGPPHHVGYQGDHEFTALTVYAFAAKQAAQ